MKRVGKILLLVLAALAVVVGIAVVTLRHSLPPLKEGQSAEALAQRIEKAVCTECWGKTLAVRWGFGGRHQHLWDRQRNLCQVNFGDTKVLVDLDKVQGRAYRAGNEIVGAEAEKLVKKAYAYWINDSFWLNPLAKLHDPGTERLLTQDDRGGEALLLRYQSGGLTPGDSYLWHLSPDGIPRAWRMWVSIIPVGGLEASWDDWVTLSTGAKIATTHRIAFFTLRITDVAGAETLAQLVPGPDPFLPIAPANAKAQPAP